jgi:uncharacterized protein (TIGR02246 family)
MAMSMSLRSTRRALIEVVAPAVTLACLAVGTAQPVSAADARAEIEARLVEMEQLWAAGDAKGLVEQLYTDDVVIAGEGMPSPVQGKGQAEQLVTELIKGSKTADLELKQFKQLGPEAASSWVVWRLPPAEGQTDPMLIRSLFVWEKQGGAWRMSADMYSVGPF